MMPSGLVRLLRALWIVPLLLVVMIAVALTSQYQQPAGAQIPPIYGTCVPFNPVNEGSAR